MLNTFPAFKTLLLAWDTWAFTTILVIALPIYAFFSFRPGMKSQSSTEKSSKLSFYLQIIFIQWFLLACLLLVAHRHNISLSDIGQNIRNPIRVLGVSIALVFVVIVLLLLDFQKHSRMSPNELTTTLAPVKVFFPVGSAEIFAAIALAITAGICEELLYRGWLLNLIRSATGSLWVAIFLSGLAFGFGHSYQGSKGILSTGIVGIFLGVLFVLVGSLLPLQIIHILGDAGGVLMGSALLACATATPSTA